MMLLLHLLVIVLMVLLLNHDLWWRLMIGMGAGQELWVDVMRPLGEKRSLRVLESFFHENSNESTKQRETKRNKIRNGKPGGKREENTGT
jgi:hypothetical protein